MKRAALLLCGLLVSACHVSSRRVPAAAASSEGAPDQPAGATDGRPQQPSSTSAETEPVGPAERAADAGQEHQDHGHPYVADEGSIDDDPNDDGGSDGARQIVAHPLSEWPDSAIEEAVARDVATLGPMSLGSPSSGALINAVRMPDNELWSLVDPNHAWGTQETVDYLAAAIRRVHRDHPGSPKLHIGHISGQRGGHLRPHISHQSGRDVDISYFYSGPSSWYARAHAGNLDRERTWAFVTALVAETDVEMILIDHSIQRLLREYAEKRGDDPAWLDELFRGGRGLRPIIRHAPGHASHLHIRFYSPLAQETARRAHPLLVRHKLIALPQAYVSHKVKPGETLGMLAKKYGTTVQAIQRANGLKTSKIQARRVYRVPTSARAALPTPARNPLSIPRRRWPPAATRAGAAPTAALGRESSGDATGGRGPQQVSTMKNR